MASATFELRAVDKTAQAFASIQNSMSRLHSTTKTIGTTLKSFFGLQAFISLGRSINAMFEEVEANSKKFGTTAEELNRLTRVTGAVDEGMNFLKKSAVFVADKLLGVKDAIFGVSQVQSASIADKIRIDRDAPKIEEAKKQLEKIKETIAAIGRTPSQQFDAIQKKILELRNKEKDPSKSSELTTLETQIDYYGLIAERMNLVDGVREKMSSGINDANKALEQYNFSLKTEAEQQKIIESQLGPIAERIKYLDSIIPRNINLESVDESMLAQMEEMIGLTEQYVALLGKRKRQETDLEIIAKKTGEIISSGFEDAILSGQKLSQVLRSLAQDMVRMVFNQLVTQKMATGISSFLAGIGMKAGGGPVSGGTPYIVGEQGPELFVPNASGSIIPNHKMGGGGGGGSGVNITYNISSGVSKSELLPILENERKRLKAEIPDMVRRGGAYRAAFA